MKRWEFLAGLLLAASAAGAQTTTDGGRIVGGELASPGSAPWLVELRFSDTDPEHGDAPRWDQAKLARAPSWRWAHYCGGVLIAPAWVLTAAHCVPNDGFALNLKLRLGTQVLSEPGWTYRIDHIVRHRDYRRARGPFDIALIKIAPDPSPTDSAGQPKLVPIAVAGLSRPAATVAVRDYVWGWGATVSSPSSDATTGGLPLVSEALMQARQIPVDAVRCKAAYPADGIGDGVMCATGDTPGKDSCGGDSGGPLTQGMGPGALLIGLVSFGDLVCGTKPGVYTDVAFYKDWIHDKLGPDVGGLVR